MKTHRTRQRHAHPVTREAREQSLPRPAHDGILYHRSEFAISRGYAEFHEIRIARYEGCSDS
jgi:hypothetical protein